MFDAFFQTALADVDSGYLNGEESSSEQSSCRGEADVVDSGMEVRSGLFKFNLLHSPLYFYRWSKKSQIF